MSIFLINKLRIHESVYMRFLLILIISLFSFQLFSQTDTLRLNFVMRGGKPVQYPVKITFPGTNKSMFVFGSKAIITNLEKKSYNILIQSDYLRKRNFQVTLDHFTNTPTITLDPFWIMVNKATFFFSQVSFNEYWQGGGINNLNFGVRYDGNLSYIREKFNHETLIFVRHGFLRQGGNAFIKNEDEVNIVAKESHRIGKNLNISALISVRTSLYSTYSLNTDGTQGNLINDFLSPGIFNLGTGLDYTLPTKNFNVYYSPINLRTNIVSKEELRSIYMPDGFDGAVRFEMGSLLRYNVDFEIFKNIFIFSRGEFFSNYLVNFGNIDVNAEGGLRFQVNNVLTASLMAQIIYDDDIQFNIRDEAGEPTDMFGPRTQFRQAFNIQLSYAF